MEKRKFKIYILENNQELGLFASRKVGEILEKYTNQLNKKSICVFAAAPSQDTFLENLSKNKNINWENIYAFHLDEYTDLPIGHPNTFQEYLKTHIFEKVDIPEENIFYMKDAGNSPDEIIENYTKSFMEKYKEVKNNGGIYLAFIGIGVNGHIAFNEPGTDLWTDEFVIKIKIDEISVKQQYDDYKNHPNPKARYKSLDEVPRNALTMTVSAILLSDKIFCMVPGKQKSNAVKQTIDGDITNKVPSSFLRLHQDVSLFLDQDSAYLLLKKPENKIKKEI
ncbi:MAG: 6-phosphogluconolactonase [Candidatus Omnitrophica bacterium]|nr:6-phosphogluconolactonase [Candidatus Omnitrophota bacterium]MCM8810456.1 6-phosphogluconolactonase [Candidatus Omnitrophota bacterium]